MINNNLKSLSKKIKIWIIINFFEISRNFKKIWVIWADKEIHLNLEWACKKMKLIVIKIDKLIKKYFFERTIKCNKIKLFFIT